MECKACGVWFVSDDKSGVCHTCKQTLKNMGLDLQYDRLRELVQADMEGRCVVLPARIGSKVYRIECVKDGDTYEIGIGEHVFDYLLFATERKNIGNTIFFTREAAEAALKEREKNEP